MMKKLFIAMAAMLSVTAFALGEMRVDIRAVDKQQLGDIKAAGVKTRLMKPDFLLVLTPTLTDQWQKFEFTFTPDCDGRFSVSFHTPGSKSTANIKPALVDDIKITGAELKNGGFEKLTSAGTPATWRLRPEAKLVTEGAFEGKNCMRIFYGKGLIYNVVRSTADQPVTVSFMAKLAK